MFTCLPTAYAKQPKKSVVALGRDVQWFTNSSRLRNQRSLYPLPPHLSELLKALIGSVLTVLHTGITLLFKPLIGYCIAYWDSFTSQAFDWLWSYVWPCLIHSFSVCLTPLITFVQGLAGNTSLSHQLIEVTASHSSSSFRMASGRQKGIRWLK